MAVLVCHRRPRVWSLDQDEQTQRDATNGSEAQDGDASVGRRDSLELADDPDSIPGRWENQKLATRKPASHRCPIGILGLLRTLSAYA